MCHRHERWLSVLQASDQVVLLPPFHASISKRLVKPARLYHTDTGIASYLIGVQDRDPASRARFSSVPKCDGCV